MPSVRRLWVAFPLGFIIHQVLSCCHVEAYFSGFDSADVVARGFGTILFSTFFYIIGLRGGFFSEGWERYGCRGSQARASAGLIILWR